ncbi:uncharacterized protein [Zea mays]|uniref:RNA-binding (RRM/RBD/RNP motifs) family protein n=1 Tax=Zea mays TaxID=4577 RepID=A0A1D6EMC7_MAIZE|nr:uncharacterized protein LOC100383203 isoform X2 [Zea mays]ONM21025.1 RNA-binding (RRM/RBD/RNP motifs) family protein [Zea mays]|eukprot:XP_008668383.1 uncharacterized protein LOC100383203 isoform X2 [Zea mays]
MASSPPRAPQLFPFDLNVAQEEVDEEPIEVLEEDVDEEGAPLAQPQEVVVEEVVEKLVEHAVPITEDEPAEDVIMEEPSEEVIMEDEEPTPSPAEEVVGEGKRRKKRVDYEVFVSGLPQDAAEEDVAQALADAGDIEEVRLVRDPADQRLNKGFAFVRFAAAWQARWAANDLREATIKGKACGICKNSETETLHLRNICFDWSKDDLAEKLKPFKLENLDRINLIEHPDRKGKNRGYAFLDFRTHVDAVEAFVKLQKIDLYLGTDSRANISFSNTLSQDDEIMEKVKSVFLDGVPPHWDEDKVREIFGKFGEIDSIQLARNMFTAARKDFGFIGFTARQSALDCIKMVNKDGVGEGSGKVPIKASLQRPRHAFKKYSRQGSSSLLGVRRGFVDKSSSGRGHHSDRYRHFSPVRRSYSDNHSRRHSIDVEERHTSVRGYRAYYRRDSPVHAPSYKYGRTHLETRISEEYTEGRYTSKYPKHRHTMHGTMERDANRRIKYGHSYQERAHRTCPGCKLCGQNYNYPNGEEFSAISGCQEAYYQTDHDLIPSTSQVASHCEGSCCKGQQLKPKSYSVMRDYDYINQESTPSSSDHARTRSNLPAPPHHWHVKHSNEHRRSGKAEAGIYLPKMLQVLTPGSTIGQQDKL